MTYDLSGGITAEGSAWPRPTSLIGRASELGLLESAAAASRTAAQFVAVVGEPGVGKTHLLSVLHSELAAAEWRMLSGRASGPGAGLPFGLLVDALDGVLGEVIDGMPEVPDGQAGVGTPAGPTAADLRLLAGVFPALEGQVSAADPGRPAGTADCYRICRAVSGLLDRLAQPNPLLLLFDDVHDADPQSIQVIDYLAQHPPGAQVLIVVAYRPRQAALLPWATAGANSAPPVWLVALAPLAAEDMDQLIPRDVPAARRHTLIEASAGYPGVLLPLLGSTPCLSGRAYGPEDLRIGVPPVPLEAFPAELRTLTPRARLVAEAAAVFGSPFEPDLVAAVAEMPEQEVLDGLDELLAVDLVRADGLWRRFRFRDVAVRAAVYHASGGGWRCAAHDRAVDALSKRKIPPVRSAHHLEHAAAGGVKDAEILMAAAREELFIAPARAVRWLQTSRRLQPGHEPGEVCGLLAIALAASGHTAQSLQLYEEACAAGCTSSELRAEAAAWCARALRLDGEPAAAHQLISAVPSEALTADTRVEDMTISLELGHPDAGISAELARLCQANGHAFALGQHWEQAAMCAHAGALLALRAVGQQQPAKAVAYTRTARELVDELADRRVASRLEALYWLAEAEFQLRKLAPAQQHLCRGIELAARYQQEPLAGRMRSRLEQARAQAVLPDREPARQATPQAPIRAVSAPAGEPSGAGMPAGSPAVYPAAAPRELPAAPMLAPPEPGPAEQRIDAVVTLLSNREREIARFVSDGLTNQQIARRLAISPKTVETHLGRVFGKLGVSSRAQVAHLIGQAGPAPRSHSRPR